MQEIAFSLSGKGFKHSSLYPAAVNTTPISEFSAILV